MQFDKDLKSEHGHLFLKIRTFLLKDEDISEQKKVRITSYFFAGSGLCHVRTVRNGVDIGLLKGFQLQDKFRLLKGEGKKVRVLNLQQFSEQKLSYYIDQAKQMNA